jgi:hypothetical protein
MNRIKKGKIREKGYIEMDKVDKGKGLIKETRDESDILRVLYNNEKEGK